MLSELEKRGSDEDDVNQVQCDCARSFFAGVSSSWLRPFAVALGGLFGRASHSA